MLYLSRFTFPDKEMEFDFHLYQRRTCYDTFYPFGVLSGKHAAQASAGFGKNLRSDMFDAVQSYSFSNIDKFSSSSIVTRLTTDVTNIQTYVCQITDTSSTSGTNGKTFTATVTIADMTDPYQCTITSDNGTTFVNNSGSNIVLTAHLFNGGVEITDTMGPDDLRRAVQIPLKSRDAGFEPNKR